LIFKPEHANFLERESTNTYYPYTYGIRSNQQKQHRSTQVLMVTFSVYRVAL
jgi:hypothetical protein